MDEAWRSVFEVGRQYLVTKEMRGYLGMNFSLGMTVTYKSCGYVPYDEVRVYEFVVKGEQSKAALWFLHVEDSPDSWTEFLSPL
jgi:hypothetical protein